MPAMRRFLREGARGQVIVLIALAMVAMLAAVALVIDGGNAYAQQRKTQNGIDASAESGTAQLARRMVGVTITDADVMSAITQTATANDITTVDDADYVDLAGVILGSVTQKLLHLAACPVLCIPSPRDK